MKSLLKKLYDNSQFTSNTYRDYDMSVDLNIARKYEGKDFVWLSREHGGVLFPLKAGINPAYLSAYKSLNQAEWYLISKGEATAISADEALTLANQLPELTASTVGVIEKIKTLLGDGNITTSGLTSCSIKETDPYTWERWRSWFSSTDNKVMEHVMSKGIATLS